jgi:steroid 5-alpha reductase family enzyme
MPAPLIALLALVALSAGFAAVFRLACRMDNYGIVDIAWSYAFAALAGFYALAGEGWGPRRVSIAALVVVWSLRLGTHLYRRVMSHHPEEDTRYQELRRSWAANFPSKMFWFFQSQAVSVVVLGLPFWLIMRNPAPAFHPLEIAGAALWLIAFSCEALADAQLAAFRRDPANRGRVCQRGLWRYSRHPNYFFEWLIWVAYFVIALASPWGWTAVIAPATMLYLLLCVTGVPMAEAQSLKSKGDAFRRYQETTSAFVPWFPRR